MTQIFAQQRREMCRYEGIISCRIFTRYDTPQEEAQRPGWSPAKAVSGGYARSGKAEVI